MLKFLLLRFSIHSSWSRAQFNVLQIARIRRSISSYSGIDDLSRLLQGHVPRRHLLQIHARIFPPGWHQDNLIATRLIGHYPGESALKVFYSLRNPYIFPFNAIIRVFAVEGLSRNAVLIFKELKCRPVFPNDLTFSFLLKACSRDGVDAKSVKQIHSDVVKLGFAFNSFVSNGMLMAYAKGIRDLASARQVFDEMPDRNLICCWTSLISGYAKLGLPEEALNLFTTMLTENLRPENDTMVGVLSACSSFDIQHIKKWLNLLSKHAEEFNNFRSDCANIILVYLYGKCQKIEKSREAFDELSENGKRSVLSWNAMIGAYDQMGFALEALAVFRSMMASNYCRPNHVTMVSVLSACAEIGDLMLGSWVHQYMRNEGQKGVLSSNVNLATALINMYAKCGNLDDAMKVFNEMRRKDVVSVNAMIMGFAINGKGDMALRLFSGMQELGLSPDSGTFLGALCACSHSGMLHEGHEIFNKMTIAPRVEHYACYIDLLSRSGFIEEAIGVTASMPFEPNSFVWGSLLAGCVLHKRLELSRFISSMLVEVDPESSGGYVMLSNSLAAESLWRDVSSLRGVMRAKRVAKQPGRSWINVDGMVHEFVASSSLWNGMECIHQMMESLLKEMKLSSS